MAKAKKQAVAPGWSAEELQRATIASFMRHGMSLNQALIMSAQIGRENSYVPSVFFGYHDDPKNGKLNLGMMSWQGPRGRKLRERLRKAGLLTANGMERSVRSIDAMTQFMLDEMKTIPYYKKTREVFLDNPDVSYNDAMAVLDKNFIGWATNVPKIRAAGNRRNKDYYNRALEYAKSGGFEGADALPASAPEDGPSAAAAFSIPASPLNLFGDLNPQAQQPNLSAVPYASPYNGQIYGWRGFNQQQPPPVNLGGVEIPSIESIWSSSAVPPGQMNPEGPAAGTVTPPGLMSTEPQGPPPDLFGSGSSLYGAPANGQIYSPYAYGPRAGSSPMSLVGAWANYKTN